MKHLLITFIWLASFDSFVYSIARADNFDHSSASLIEKNQEKIKL